MKVVKDHFFILALLAMFVGLSAFKMAEPSSAPADGWYEVSLIDPGLLPEPNIPSNQQIGEKLDVNPPAFGSGCATANSGDRCAIHLAFDPNVTDVPETVAEADGDNGITVGQDSNYP